jgi:hypothetical protein
MYYLYAAKTGKSRKLVSTFDSEQQLRAYVNWATLSTNADGSRKFEQGSTLAGYQHWESSETPVDESDPSEVIHNPSPSML